MKTLAIACGAALMLAGCSVSSVGYDSAGLEPIPGSITYGGQPRTRLRKAPVGSLVPHTFNNQFGQRVDEQYVIQPDRSLKLISRRIHRDFWGRD